MLHIEEEKMRDGFVKHHIHGLGFNAVIHELDGSDLDVIQDHPFSFTSFILNGSYVETQYKWDERGQLFSKEFKRVAGDSHYVDARTIHKITAFPDGKCTTLILPKEKTHNWGIYEIRDKGFWFKEFGQDGWIKI